ncbi:hypothetical protein PTKIN_Ptkin15bG0191400 [Pterospermum kingtungense]
MAQEASNPEPVVIGEEIKHVQLINLNKPRHLNVISSEVGAGPAFCAGGDLKMFYEGRKSKDSCLEVVYRMYWLCYHIHTYKKTQVALAQGITMGGGASLVVPMKFSVVTEKTVFETPEASIGFHVDCSFSYIHSHLPGIWANGKELVAAGPATHFVPSEKLLELDKRLISLNSRDENAVKAMIEEFLWPCSLMKTEEEANKEGNGWIAPVLKGLKRSSPTGLKITLRSIREGRKQTLPECLKKEFRLTMNILWTTISADVYEGVRALTIDEDNAPKWDPSVLDQVDNEKVDL